MSLPRWVTEELEGWVADKRTGTLTLRFKAGMVRSLDRQENVAAPELRGFVRTTVAGPEPPPSGCVKG